MRELHQIIEQAWEQGANLSPGAASARIGDAVVHVPGELDCAVIVKQVETQTRAKTAINELLRY